MRFFGWLVVFGFGCFAAAVVGFDGFVIIVVVVIMFVRKTSNSVQCTMAMGIGKGVGGLEGISAPILFVIK